METGYVYIFTNPSLSSVKIGQTTDVEARLKSLYRTNIPTPFEKYATLQTAKFKSVEKIVRKTLDRFIVRPNREFFDIEPEKALDILKDINTLLDDGKIKEYNNEIETEEISASGKRRPAFKFHMANIAKGEKVTFAPIGIDVTVVSDDKVEYEGRRYSLSYFTKAFMPESEQNNSESYQGPKYFTYKGKTLVDLRDEFENK